MRNAPWAKPFFAAIEPIEIMLWSKSETLLRARFKMGLGLILTMLTQLQTINITPLMPIVPEGYRGFVTVAFNMLPFLITISGWVDEKMRKDTTMPVEVVAMPMNAPPEVKAVVAEAQAANQTAAAIVAAEAKKI
jgi:hypothetical protein